MILAPSPRKGDAVSTPVASKPVGLRCADSEPENWADADEPVRYRRDIVFLTGHGNIPASVQAMKAGAVEFLNKPFDERGLLGAAVFDAAIIRKDATGQVGIHETEMPTQYAAWSGLAVGALLGIFFPSYLIRELLGGAALGALIRHLLGGMSRSDLKHVGETLQSSTTALSKAVNESLKDLNKATQ